MTITERIKERAQALGFDRVGVAAAEPFDELAERLVAWLAAGRHGTMRYMERSVDAWRDPSRVLPGARSIIAVAANYYASEPADAAGAPGRAKISRYAWGRNYHVVLRERMEALLAEIREIAPGCEGRVATDAVPLPERAIAERAGLGWIGKNANLITETHGSWVFLGEILVTIVLDADAPFAADLCGSCVRCIDACPTGAIVGPGEVDASRCISYATVEHRGTIPESFRGKMDGWVFGCDVCQDVCPWNAAPQKSRIADFLPRARAVNVTPEALARLPRDEYRERYADSAVRRTRCEGLRRNARFLLEEVG